VLPNKRAVDPSDDPTSSASGPKEPIFLTLHGVPRHDPPPEGQQAYILDPQGAWRSVHGDLLYEIEAECVRLHDAFASALFGGIGAYYALLPAIPPFVYEAGLNSESTLSRGAFEQAVASLRDMPYLHPVELRVPKNLNHLALGVIIQDFLGPWCKIPVHRCPVACSQTHCHAYPPSRNSTGS